MPEKGGKLRENVELRRRRVYIASFGEDEDGELYIVNYGGQARRLKLAE